MRQPKDPAVRAAIAGLSSVRTGRWDAIHDAIEQLKRLAFALEDAAPPDDWVLVPVEPTRDMRQAGALVPMPDGIGGIYRAMIAARPLPAPPARGEGE